MNDTELSKTMTFYLRHRPDKAGLALGDEGYVSTQELLDALRRIARLGDVTRHDIERVVRDSPKQRFEMADGRIRARYGHSVKEAVTYEAVQPPDLLYHGTSPRAVEAIREKGLLLMGRQHVHLSTDQSQAASVGKRHSKIDAPVILQVSAKEAWEGGVKFYQPEPRIFLADPVPALYLIFESL